MFVHLISEIEKLEKAIGDLSEAINTIEKDILSIESKLRVPWEALSREDHEFYGSKDHLREKER